MLFKVLLVTAAVCLTERPLGVVAEFPGDTGRSGPSYVTPSPTPYGPDTPYSSEGKSFKEDDRRIYSGPSHARTGPPKHLGPGPGPLSYSGSGLPLSLPQRYHPSLPAGSVIGYLAYPQPIVPGGYPPLHDGGLVPSAAFSHFAYASPIAFTHYPKPVPLGPGAAGPGYSAPPHSNYRK